MDPEAMRRCLSFGFSDKKSKSAIEKYGNGFKTSSMRLGGDAIVFSRNFVDRTLTQSIGLLSYTFLTRSGYGRIVVPMLNELNGSHNLFGSRGKRKYVALNGTVSTPNHHFRNRRSSDDPSNGEIETFRKLHFREKDGWVNDYSRTSYENMVEIKRQTESTEDPSDDLEIMQQVLGKRPAYIRGWSRVPSTRSNSTSSRHSTGASGRLSHTEMSTRLDSIESELATTKSELSAVKNQMAVLEQLVRSVVSGQSLPSFSSSLNVQDHGSETRDH